MKCLIDADVLVYEIGFASQWVDDDGVKQVLDPEKVEENIDQRVKEIEEECWADEPSTLYLTVNDWVNKYLVRRPPNGADKYEPHKPNFRIELAKTKPYKGNRKEEKPFHYYNILAYLLRSYDVVVSDGMEADDTMSVHQIQAPPLSTVICTRDKDLRMIPGMHYGWPCGKQPQLGPLEVDEVGSVELSKQGIKGTGLAFFYSQLLTGDTVDNIPGLPKVGPKKALELLGGLDDPDEMFKAVVDLYKEKIGDGWREYMLEQGQLLWMVRELDEEGGPVLWNPTLE